jgi:AcrR family transcriptional regulator
VSSARELTPRTRAKRDQIRAGAERMFLERGFAGTSTDAIAAASGVSKQTLYVYYPSKEDLLVDVLRHLIHEDAQHTPWVVEQDGLATVREVRQALSALARTLVANLMHPEYLALMRVVIAETPRLPQLGRLFRSAIPEQVLAHVAQILERGRATGVVAEVDVDAAARLFTGALLTYVLLDGLLVGDAPSQPPSDERIEAVVHLFLRTIT